MSRLFHIEEERYEPHPVFQLWRRARERAVTRDQLPLVVVSGPEWRGRLVVVHESDLAALVGEQLDEVIGR
jgi:hypothetical protein